MAKITGRQIIGQLHQICHRTGGNIGQAGARQLGLDLVAAGRVVVKACGIGIGVLFKGQAQLGLGGQLACGHNQLRIARRPGIQRALDHRGQAIGGLFHEYGAGAGEKANRFQRIHHHGRIFAQIGGADPAEAHFLFAGFANQRCNHLLAFQGHAHGIGAIDQQARAIGIGALKIFRRLAPRQFHGSVSAAANRRLTIISAKITIRRNSALRAAALVATGVPAVE